MEDSLRNDGRNLKHYKSVIEDIVKFAKTTYNLNLTYEEEDNGYCWSLNFGGVYLFADDDFSVKGFSTGYEVYESGSYWEPPSSDYVEHSSNKTIRQAMGDIISLLIMNEYQLYIENEWGKEQEQDYERESERKTEEEN